MLQRNPMQTPYLIPFSTQARDQLHYTSFFQTVCQPSEYLH